MSDIEDMEEEGSSRKIPKKRSVGKKNPSVVREFPPTNFSETPPQGNPGSIMAGDRVTLTRSQRVLDGSNALWLSGVEATVTALHDLESGYVAATVSREDKTTTVLYVAWLEKRVVPIIVY